MSGWDWIHAGLEVATYAQAQKAQRNLSAMRTAAEMESARRALLEAMKSFIFDISRDIQLAEEQVSQYPQQVYIVSKSLDWRFTNSGLSADVFPDFQDKEYVFKTQKKIAEVVARSKESLAQSQVEQSDVAVQYIAEMPLLQQAIPAKAAQESLRDTEGNWQELSGRQGRKNLLMALGILGLGLTLCVACPLASSGFGMLGIGLTNGDFGSLLGGFVTMALIGAIPIGTIVLFVLVGRSPNPDYAPLKAQREKWQKQLLPPADWNQVVSTFGDLSSEQFNKIYEERLAFLNPILGGDFQKYLGASE